MKGSYSNQKEKSEMLSPFLYVYVIWDSFFVCRDTEGIEKLNHFIILVGKRKTGETPVLVILSVGILSFENLIYELFSFLR